MSRDWGAVIAGMTLDEKASLTNGVDFWNLAAVERLGIPSIQVTDGPNGARGARCSGSGARRRSASRAVPRSAPPGIRR